MKLSTRGRYGVRALLDLAQHLDQSPIALKEIAQRQKISLQYLEHLVTPLIAGGLLKSTRGARGGVRLSRPAANITLSEIIRLLEGSTAPVECVDRPDLCSQSGICATRDIWTEIMDAIDNVLNATTLQDLVERQREKQEPEVIMYYI